MKITVKNLTLNKIKLDRYNHRKIAEEIEQILKYLGVEGKVEVK